MFRSLLRRKSARPLALLLSLAVLVAASVPLITRGVGAAQDESQPPSSPRGANDKASPSNIMAGAEFVPGEALVRFRDEATAKSAEAAPLRAADGEIGVSFGRFEGSEMVRGLRLAKVDPARTLEAIAELARRADVLYAEPNYIWRATRMPNDPRFRSGEMYGLYNTFAPLAWDVTTGSGDVTVGVIDTGVDINHPDLQENIWRNPAEVPGNGVDDDGNGYIDDVNGWDFSTCERGAPSTAICGNSTVFDNASDDAHGTHVSGTIGARGDNNIGVTGVSWDVRIMPIKVLGAEGGATSNIIRGYNYALRMRQRWESSGKTQGANIRALNNSYGGPGKSLAALDAILQLNQAGILFVVAAGNQARDNFNFSEYPSNYDAPNLIAVAATDGNNLLSGFSNFGARLVSMGAPGSRILSTTPNNTYSFFSGTSMSTPHVTGAAALVCAARPDITLSQLRGVLTFTGDVTPALQGKTTTGRKLNVSKAIQSALQNDTTAPAPAGDLRVASQNGRSITLAWSAPGDDGNSGAAADYDFFFINPTTGGRTLLPTTLLPIQAGAPQSVAVDVPFLNFSGTIQLRAYDDAGNRSDANIGVTIPVNHGSDPYTVTPGGAQPLSQSTATNLFPAGGDDKYAAYSLPFAFPFYGEPRVALTVSTNGTLYFSTPPRRDDGDADDARGSIESLQGQTMIAGLWDDIDVNLSARSGSGVYVVQPDANRIIFRWIGVTFTTPHANIEFEIELRNNGTIQMRYGDNSRVFPVVGLSGGEPDAYVVASHTRELVSSSTQPISLTNAQALSFDPRPQLNSGPQTIQFAAPNFTVAESSAFRYHSALLLVTRTGDSSGAASVDVRTIDDPAAIPCDPTLRDANNNSYPQGTAYARCDYATTIDTVQFAPGETIKGVLVPIIDDAFVEQPERTQVVLSNPIGGAALGTQRGATLTITDNDTGGATANPILSNTFFVRQQYLDFLSREAEAGEPWTNILNNCSDVNNNPACDRLTVSASFFGSVEFQLKGFFVYRFYSVSFGRERLPRYTEIVSDMRSVTGATPAEVFQKRTQFAQDWVARPDFQQLYGQMSAEAFVTALMDRFGLQRVTTPDPRNPDGTAKVTLTRAELAAQLSAATLSRAQVVRAIVESDELFAAEYNRAFVAMQYFGYLRRDPEAAGFEAWLRYLTANPQDARTMVRGFANSQEYLLRFGRPL